MFATLICPAAEQGNISVLNFFCFTNEGNGEKSRRRDRARRRTTLKALYGTTWWDVTKTRNGEQGKGSKKWEQNWQRIGNGGRFPFNQNVRFAKFSVTSSHLDRALTRAGLNWWRHERCDNILGISMHCGMAIVTPLVQVRVCSLVLRTSPLSSGGSRGENRGGRAPLFLDQTEARRAGKYFLLTAPPLLLLISGSGWPPPPPPPLSEGLVPPLLPAPLSSY